ncbi:30S ribosomal protein S1 [Candidatus Legionella polyplacis]|uniref:30S ribosomal protein S1 n=1 Tax=Candidatus Legionella polyplacis TaxID=2005262 RepID=UPI000C1DD273|nr:30S ribosomal protein S1 [Candidatus Legionella polyplacis]ATW01667.1 30S ribosomal protein S1 [Candidatus Legionella polyplacis]
MEETFKELFERCVNKIKFSPGSIISAKVININNNYVTLNAGLKSEGIISIEEFKDKEGKLEINIGDTVEVSLDSIEDGYGETLLSREKAKRKRAWEKLSTCYNKNKNVVGLISNKVKGGFTVEIGNIKAFLPGSLVDIRPIRDPSYLEGTEVEFKVIKMDFKRNNIVVSRKAVIEEENNIDKKVFLDSLHEGQILNGVVKNLTDYGAFIDLGGIDGLLHITDISWKRIKNPNELLSIGQEIKVIILHFDNKKNRVSLGMKQLTNDPWINLINRYPIGKKVQGKVTNITDYGCFVEIEEGIEGLVHMSEMDWTNKNIHPNKILSLGDNINIMILEIDQKRRRISLGMKQCTKNPWKEFSKFNKKGDKVNGKIRSITEFGIFVGLHGGIDGLIHLSDITSNTNSEEEIKKFKKGQNIEALILSIDIDRERISLGLKQLVNNYFSIYMEEHPKGCIVNGKLLDINNKKILVKLTDNVKGVIDTSDFIDVYKNLSIENLMKNKNEFLKKIQKLELQIIDFDKKNLYVILSVKIDKKNYQEKIKSIKKYSCNSNISPVTLGDLIKEKLHIKNNNKK